MVFTAGSGAVDLASLHAVEGEAAHHAAIVGRAAALPLDTGDEAERDTTIKTTPKVNTTPAPTNAMVDTVPVVRASSRSSIPLSSHSIPVQYCSLSFCFENVRNPK